MNKKLREIIKDLIKTSAVLDNMKRMKKENTEEMLEMLLKEDFLTKEDKGLNSGLVYLFCKGKIVMFVEKNKLTYSLRGNLIDNKLVKNEKKENI